MGKNNRIIHDENEKKRLARTGVYHPYADVAAHTFFGFLAVCKF